MSRSGGPRSSPLAWMREELDRLREAAQYRTLTTSAPVAGEEGWITLNGRKMLNLASNHYLGLNHRLDAAALARWGTRASEAGADGADLRTGAAASRLIVGGSPVMSAFERDFARYKGTEGCLLFGNGYMANVGIITALVGRNDLVFSDRLNHASIVDGALLSRAELIRYRHRDMEHLESLLRKADPGKRKLIVTDSIFSMDGSIAPLRELVELKETYNAMLMVDEAHSGGLYGEAGEGLVHALGLTGRVDVVMGTFSKAYGCYGAYAAGERLLIEYLVNKARSVIYSTALPPMVVCAIRDQWETVKRDGWRRDELQRKSNLLRSELVRAGFNTGDSECQIVPVIVGRNEQAVEFGRRLQDAAIAAVPVRPPTVPEGSARIRFTVMATHRDEDLMEAVARIRRIGEELGVM